MHLLIQPVLASQKLGLVGQGFLTQASEHVKEIQSGMGFEHGGKLKDSRLHTDRRPQVGRLQFLLDAVKSFAHHADYFEWRPIDRDRFPHDLRVGGKRLLPEVVAEDDDRAGSRGRIVRRKNRAPKQRVRAENAEVISGNKIRRSQQSWGIGNSSGPGCEPHTHLVRKAAIGGDSLKGPGIGLKLPREIPGEVAAKLPEVDAARDSRGFRVAECHQLLWIAYRQVTQQDLVDQGEDCCIRANSEGQ